MNTTPAVAVPDSEIEDEYKAIAIPLAKIYCDNDFNCRGDITPISVMELAKDIDKNKLQFPIAVQPRSDTLAYAKVPEEFDFRIIAGHRRFKAFQLLKRETIPCMVKTGYTELQCLVLNLGENLKREDLNILQEALAIKKLWAAGVGRNEVGKELGKSSGWVQARYALLELPEDIQQEAALGVLNQYQVKQLAGLSSKDEMYEQVRKIKTAKQNGEKPPKRVAKHKPRPVTSKKEREQSEITAMSEVVAKNLGYGITTRFAAWASGFITTEEFFSDIKAEKNTGLTSKLVAYKEGDLDGHELLKELDRDSEIKRRPLILPEEL